MNRYKIINARSGHDFGVYEGDTPDDAIDAMMDDAKSSEQPLDDIIAILQ